MPGRRFYEDEETVTPLPGTVIPASQTEVEALGPNKLINGSSVRSPSFLESKIQIGRDYFNNFYTQTTSTVNDLTKKYHEKEQNLTTTLANLHTKDEDLIPAATYILVATLSGTILTRLSNFALKALVPVVFGLTAFKYTLPKTFANTTTFAHKVEHATLPALATKQDELLKEAGSLVAQSEVQTKKAQQQVDGFFKTLKNTFKKFTGLRIDEDVTKK